MASTKNFSAPIVTPSGTPLGGWINLDIRSDGTYHVHFHMHSSSVFGDFDFTLRAYLGTSETPTFFFHHDGHVSGVDDSDYEEDGTNPLLALYFDRLQNDRAYSVAKDYTWAGVVGTIDDLLKDILDIGAGALGATLGAVIGMTREAISWLGVTLGAGGTIGVIAGVIVFAVGSIAGLPLGSALLLGVAGGAAVGAVVNALIQQRPLSATEIDFAKTLFEDTIPWGDVILTNIGGLSGRPFTAPGVDGKTYCNLGDAYNGPQEFTNGAYPRPGQVLIHELTHAWQIARSKFIPGLLCSGIVNQANYTFGDNVYAYADAGPAWDSLNLEQQAAITDQWFGGNGRQAAWRPMDEDSPYFPYMAAQGWGGGEPAMRWESRHADSDLGAVSRARNHLDIFWARPDGAIGSTWWDGAPNCNWGDHQPFAITAPGLAPSGAPVTALARTTNHLDVFWVNLDGSVWSQWWDGAPGCSWGDHRPFPIAPAGAATPGSRIAAVARNANHMDVFWIGPDGAVASTWWDGAPGCNWGDHQPFPIAPPGAAQTASGVTAVSRTPNHMDVFWIGPDGAVGSTWWDGAPGCNWGDHGPFPITPPGAACFAASITAVARSDDHLDVFWIGPDGAVGSMWWDAAPNCGWGDHQPFPISPPGAAQPGSPLAAVARTSNHMDVFWIGPDGAVGSTWWDAAPNCNWGDHPPFAITPPGAAQPGSPMAAVARTPDHLDVFWVGSDGAVGSMWWDSAPNCGWGDHQPFAVTPPDAAQRPGSERPRSSSFALARTAGHLDVFWSRHDGAIGSNWWDIAPGCGWGDHAPFPICAAGVAEFGLPVATVAREPDQMDVFWVQRDGSIWTQWWHGALGASWGDHAAFAIAPPGSARALSRIAAVARTPTHLDVFWIGPDGAIGSTWWDAAPDCGWGDHQPFAISPPNAAGAESGLAAVARAPMHLDVFWIGDDGAVGSTWWDAAPKCSWGDHSPFAITPPNAVRAASPIVAVGRTPNHLDVFWIGPDGAIGSTWWDSAPKCGWGDHSPFPIAQPGAAGETSGLAAVARHANHLDVFWIGADGAVGSTWFDMAPGCGWGDHTPFAITPPNSARAGSPVAAAGRTHDHLDVFWVGPDGAVGSTWWDAAPNCGWGDHKPFTISPASEA